MEDLKSCPFCGGKATLENEGTQADIICDDCYASNNIQISDYFTYEERHNDPAFKWQDAPIYGYAEKGKQRATDVLTKLWNARTSDAEMATLKAELLTLQDRYNAQEKLLNKAQEVLQSVSNDLTWQEDDDRNELIEKKVCVILKRLEKRTQLKTKEA